MAILRRVSLVSERGEALAHGVYVVESGQSKVGKPAPEFSLASDSGENVSLASLKGEPVLLYLYPKDGTPAIIRSNASTGRREARACGTAPGGLGCDPPQAEGSSESLLHALLRP